MGIIQEQRRQYFENGLPWTWGRMKSSLVEALCMK